jgi:hypothetical protein
MLLLATKGGANETTARVLQLVRCNQAVNHNLLTRVNRAENPFGSIIFYKPASVYCIRNEVFRDKPN